MFDDTPVPVAVDTPVDQVLEMFPSYRFTKPVYQLHILKTMEQLPIKLAPFSKLNGAQRKLVAEDASVKGVKLINPVITQCPRPGFFCPRQRRFITAAEGPRGNSAA
ncbi:hypothetical protein EVAR_96789_1 [Eumeta japonica]|uniref:Uncharacterized protein n=1 Tax=Eumeta variegata TaxID=151549 RepID=A0A4C1WTH0_EUMVA|nr:hypothetical protein EVAR_96789_1 [Eumeta japonica]